MTKQLLDRASRGPAASASGQSTFLADGGPLPTDPPYQPRSLDGHVRWLNDRAAWLEAKDPSGQRQIPRWRITMRNGVKTCEPIELSGTPSYRRQQALARAGGATARNPKPAENRDSHSEQSPTSEEQPHAE